MGAAQAIVASQSLEFSGWLRLSHHMNRLFMVFLVRSGIEILMSHPRLYWNDGWQKDGIQALPIATHQSTTDSA